MDDVCFWHFVCRSCPHPPPCPYAHNLADLDNPQQWVLFPLVKLSAERYVSFRTPAMDRHYSIPAVGSLIRFGAAEDASCFVAASPLPEPAWPLPQFLVVAAAVARHSAQPLSAEALTQLALALATDEELHREMFAIPKGAPLPGRAPPSPASSAASSSSPAAPPLALPPGETDAVAGGVSSSPPDGPSSSAMVPSARSRKTAGRRKGRTPILPRRDASSSTQLMAQLLRQQTGQSPPAKIGWDVLQSIWGLERECIRVEARKALCDRPERQQEQILLTFAGVGLGAIKDLSGFLEHLMEEHDTAPQVCVRFFAGLCPAYGECPYHHPFGTRGWEYLAVKWGLSHRDFDLAVLNFLAKKPQKVQDSILQAFADSNLTEINNLSAFLSSVVDRIDRKKRSGALRSRACHAANAPPACAPLPYAHS